MQERDARSTDPHARRIVDQPYAGGRQRPQCGLDVIDSVGDVVEPRPTSIDEAGDTTVGAERCDQLDVRVAHVEEHCLDPLFGENFPVDKLQMQHVAIERD